MPGYNGYHHVGGSAGVDAMCFDPRISRRIQLLRFCAERADIDLQVGDLQQPLSPIFAAPHIWPLINLIVPKGQSHEPGILWRLCESTNAPNLGLELQTVRGLVRTVDGKWPKQPSDGSPNGPRGPKRQLNEGVQRLDAAERTT